MQISPKKLFYWFRKKSSKIPSISFFLFCFLEFQFSKVILGLYTGDVLSQTTLTPPTRTPSLPVRSCAFNSTECCETCILASATAPFHMLAGQPLNLIPCSFLNKPSLSLSTYLPLSLSTYLYPSLTLESQTNAINANQWPVIGAKAHSDVTVWLSRTLCQVLWVCCNVTLVAYYTQWIQCNKNNCFLKILSRFKVELHANITKYLPSVLTDSQCLLCFVFDFNAHPPYMPFQPALWLSLCLSLLACNASWVELWSKHQDKQKAMEKQSKRLFTHQKRKD